jgi:trigger factor
MKTELKILEGAKRQIEVEVTGDAVKNKFEDVFKKIGQEAKVKGFRPGHAPRAMLEKEFSGLAHEHVLRELIPEIYQQAMEQEKLDAVDLPQITDVKLERDFISFKAQFEVQPEIAIGEYKGIKLEYKKIEVKEDELKRQLDSFKESRKIDSLDDSFAKLLGYPDLAQLQKAVERQMLVQKDNAQRQQMENTIIEHITKPVTVTLPQSLVDKQLEDLVKQTKVDLALRGVAKEKINEEEKNLLKDLEPQARQQVKIYLVMAAIARKDNIPVDNNMPRNVMELLYKEAKWEIKEA